MTKDEARAILQKEEREAIKAILALAEKAEKYDQLTGPSSPNTPSSNIPTYLKESHGGRKKKPGQKKGHLGVARKTPQQIHARQEHTLDPQGGFARKQEQPEKQKLVPGEG